MYYYAERSLTGFGGRRKGDGARASSAGVATPNFGENLVQNFERGARVRALSNAQTASSTLYDGHMMCGARLGSSVSKDTKVLPSRTSYLMSCRFDRKIEARLKRVWSVSGAISGADLSRSGKL